MLSLWCASLARAQRPMLVRGGAAAATMGAPPSARAGACHCRASSVSLSGEPTGASFCHCGTCRRLSGAPCMAIVLAPLASVTVTGATIEQRTSTHVVRYRCARCFAPLAAVLAGRTAAVPLGLFDFPGGAPPGWRPQHHMYYESRVLDVRDDLPKYASSTRGALWEPAQPSSSEGGGAADVGASTS